MRTGGFVLDSPIDIVFSDYDVLQPDVVFFRGKRQHLVNLDAAIRHAPDLCVEVLSDSTADRDRGPKMQMFARYGVPEYRIVDSRARRIEVYTLAGGIYSLVIDAGADETVQSPTVDGLSFSVASAFATE